MERPLSEKYKNRIRPINIEGVIGFAWERELLIAFLKDKESDYYAILGGDVFILVNGQMEYTYDNWGVESRSPRESFDSYVKRCKEITLKYIDSYPISKNILFGPVMTSEPTAGLLSQ